MRLIPEVTCVSYSVKIPLRVFKSRCQGDTAWRTGAYLDNHSPDGIDAIEFNGHFGNYIYFRAENDKARDDFMNVIHDCFKTPKHKLPKPWN